MAIPRFYLDVLTLGMAIYAQKIFAIEASDSFLV
jgi:hypothetical protein